MPPQFYLISTLAEIMALPSPSSPVALGEQQKLIKQLAFGAFGSMVINPRGLAQPSISTRNPQATGTSSTEAAMKPMTVLTYEGDETRGGAKGRLHRSYIEYPPDGVLGRGGTGNVPYRITLVRDFDIFNDADVPAPSEDTDTKARL